MPAPATFIASHVVRPGHLEPFRAWAAEFDQAAARAAGHAGGVRLEQAGGFHHLIHRFAAPDDLERWLASPAYEQLRDAGEDHAVARTQHKAGDLVGFDLPSEASVPKWKAWLVTWLSVLPVILLVSSAIRWVLPTLPPLAQAALSSLILTATLTWIILPRVNRSSRFWQIQNTSGKVRKGSDD